LTKIRVKICSNVMSDARDGKTGAGALRPIGEAAAGLGVHPRTLMAYERIGLVKPARRSNRRVYSEAELEWLACAQDLNRTGGISRRGLATLLRFVPCWAVRARVEAGEGVGSRESGPPRFARDAATERVRRAWSGEAPERCRRCPIHRAYVNDEPTVAVADLPSEPASAATP
jgi:hypothetical protein